MLPVVVFPRLSAETNSILSSLISVPSFTSIPALDGAHLDFCSSLPMAILLTTPILVSH